MLCSITDYQGKGNFATRFLTYELVRCTYNFLYVINSDVVNYSLNVYIFYHASRLPNIDSQSRTMQNNGGQTTKKVT